jgi:hypothetical protein
MVKTLIIVLGVVLVAAGAVAAGADESTRESLQLWTRQLVQEQAEQQAREQMQIRIEASQQDTGQVTPAQIKLRLENPEMLQTRNRNQSQEQIQLQQAIGPNNGTGYQWGDLDSGNQYGLGPIPDPTRDAQSGNIPGIQQRGKP